MIKFNRMQLEDQPLIHFWRRTDRVSRMMFNDVSDSYENQVRWFERTIQDPTLRYWVFSYGSQKLGVINLASIDSRNRTATAGYYIGDFRYLTLGAMIPVYLYNHSFFSLGLNKLYGQVLSSNKKILSIHKLHGYDLVGIHKEHILRNGIYEDVTIVELMASRWRAATRYHSYHFLEDRS